MAGTGHTDDRASSQGIADRGKASLSAPLTGWMNDLRERLRPTAYVDSRDAPDPPESPYRARLTLAPEQCVDGVELREREVVRGEVKTIYEVRCGCGKRWFNRCFENVQLCPRCGRAVLLSPPGSEMP